MLNSAELKVKVIIMDTVDVVTNNGSEMSVLSSSKGIEEIFVISLVEYETTENCSEYNDDNEKLKSLLSKFNLIQLLPALQSK